MDGWWKVGTIPTNVFYDICARMGGNSAACTGGWPNANPADGVLNTNTPITAPLAVIMATGAYVEGENKKGTDYAATALSAVPILGDIGGPIAKIASDSMDDDSIPANIYLPGDEVWTDANGSWIPKLTPQQLSQTNLSIKSGWRRHTVQFPMPLIFTMVDANDPIYVQSLVGAGFIDSGTPVAGRQ
jgi:hypothetical protein